MEGTLKVLEFKHGRKNTQVFISSTQGVSPRLSVRTHRRTLLEGNRNFVVVTLEE